MCHAMPFSARALKKDIFFDVDIAVKNKSKCGFSWYVLLSITSTRHYFFPKHFFELFLLINISEFAKVFERKVWRVQAAHLRNAESESVFSVVKTKISFLWYCSKKQIEYGLAWCIVLSTTIRVIIVVKMLWTHEAQPSESATNVDHCDDVYRCR